VTWQGCRSHTENCQQTMLSGIPNEGPLNKLSTSVRMTCLLQYRPEL